MLICIHRQGHSMVMRSRRSSISTNSPSSRKLIGLLRSNCRRNQRRIRSTTKRRAIGEEIEYKKGSKIIRRLISCIGLIHCHYSVCNYTSVFPYCIVCCYNMGLPKIPGLVCLIPRAFVLVCFFGVCHGLFSSSVVFGIGREIFWILLDLAYVFGSGWTFFLTYIFGGLSFFRVTYLLALAVITTNTDNMDDDCNRCIVGALNCTHVLHHSLFLPSLLSPFLFIYLCIYLLFFPSLSPLC